MEVNRPKQRSQPSRKGKKAWRKNIDLDQIDEGLEASRTIERTVGHKLGEETPSDALFSVDVTGDSKKALKKSGGRKNRQPRLMADEILSRRSAIPAVSSKKSKNRVSKKEVDRLMRVAGRREGGAAAAIIEKDGLTSTKIYDVWGINEGESQGTTTTPDGVFATGGATTIGKVQENNYSIISHHAPTVRPETLSHEPISFQDPENFGTNLELPSAGKSYNPTVDDWKKLITEEHTKEEKKEAVRQKLEEERKRIEAIMAEMSEESDLDDDKDEELSEDEDFQPITADSLNLSINAPVVNNRKSAAQRNREVKEKERVELTQRLKLLKRQINELQNMPLESENEESEDEKEAVVKQRKRKLGKHHILGEQLEVKLSDELTDSLRRLKPEGSIAKDRFRSFQERGLIEARVKITTGRTYKRKVTEKWSYKDFK
ncbi:P60-like protein [Nadsonia fulvescens var. elongata DSM 6958]|uniref:Ribosome biogenesis protein NOP53 n=1 Tax=Nadsonia fulvescens var. elongata DSM 6958 TaxID=857566 RepID=A0A1E3PQ66_9ASCO|nr:P60-like protein [Nadsonia fulvescens var. elongata DSM 6958]